MKLYRIFLAVTVLVLASLACNGLAGSKNNATDPANQAGQSTTQVPSDNGPSSDNGKTFKTDFPMTADAYQMTDVGDGSLLYFTKMSLEDVMKFYRDEYASKGYKERELLTSVSDGVFSIVFDGDPSGKAIVIQSVDMGDGSRTVAIRLEDV